MKNKETEREKERGKKDPKQQQIMDDNETQMNGP